MIDGELLTIGELAQRTGVARSALRYYEELDILQPNDRRSGQRRYDEAAVALVGAILLLREVGFSLNQIRQIMRPASASGSAAWRDVAARKLKDLDDRIEQAEAARSALQHALALGDQLGVRPDGEDVRARRVEDPLDADLELVRGGDGGGIHRSPFVRSTTCAKRSSRCNHVLMPSKA
jgi:DNA-binding transcriptional MerR regulator